MDISIQRRQRIRDLARAGNKKIHKVRLLAVELRQFLRERGEGRISRLKSLYLSLNSAPWRLRRLNGLPDFVDRFTQLSILHLDVLDVCADVFSRLWV